MRNLRRVVLLCTAALLIAAVPAASTAVAYNKKERRAEKRQNKKINKVTRDMRRAKKTLNELRDALGGSGGTIAGLADRVGKIDTRLKTIEGAAPTLIKGLTDLKAGLEKAGEGLKAAGDGLTALGKGAAAQENGVGQVFIGANPEPFAFVVTPDIPDFVQQATVTQQFVASQDGPISLQVAVRSGENDGTGSANPAAHCRVAIVDNNGAEVVSTPNPALGPSNVPFWAINQGSKLTSTIPANGGFMFGLKTSGADADAFQNLTAAGNSTGTATADADEVFTVSLTCVDLSPSTSTPPDTEA